MCFGNLMTLNNISLNDDIREQQRTANNALVKNEARPAMNLLHLANTKRLPLTLLYTPGSHAPHILHVHLQAPALVNEYHNQNDSESWVLLVTI